MNKAVNFLNRLDDLYSKEIPPEVISRSKRSLLDYIAVTLAGEKYQEEKINNYISFAQPEPGKFTALGTGKQLALKEAVFLNGLNGHALDFDDGTNSGIIHLGSPIFSVLFPLAQRFEVSMDKLLKAAIIGYEASYTIAVSIQPGHKQRGYHATGTCGTLGATLAAAYMLDFTPEERFQAFATACVSATGVLNVLDDGSELKPYNVAKTAVMALTSIEIAKAGFNGNPDPLGSDRGFLFMMTGNSNVEIKPLMLNGTYAIQKSYTKPYASCRYTHPPVEAAVYLRNEYSISPDKIENITVDTYSLAVSKHDHTDIPSTASAKMSIPYSVAVGLIYGKAGLEEFTDEKVSDNLVKELTKKVKVNASDEYSAVFPDKQIANVVIKLNDGNEYSHRVEFPKGEPENPLSDQEFYNRYLQLVNFSGREKSFADNVYNSVMENNLPKMLKLLSERED